MTKLLLPCAVLCTVLPVLAQNCNVAPPSGTIFSQNPFAVSFYGGQSAPVPAGYTGMAELFDMTLSSAVTITALTKTTYDQGIGNPVVPNQVGNTTTVNIWTCATSWTGNQLLPPPANPTVWTLRGTGTLTVTAWPAASPVVLATPISMPAGSYGVALETLQTTTGTNPGPLHCVYATTTNPASDQFVSLSNEAVQNSAFQSGQFIGNINISITYTPAANAGIYVPFGSGCYFHPQAFYQDVLPPSAPSPLSNTGMTWFNLGNHYLVTSAAPNIVAPTTTSITTGAYGASSSASWDDASSLPFTLPFTFNYPGGSTSTICIGSNGYVFLINNTNGAFSVVAAPYGSLATFSANGPRICPYYHDLDPTSGGGIYYEPDPSNNFVRILWQNIPEWSTTSLNTMQVVLWSSGQVDISYGVVGNSGGGQAAGNDAIIGFTPGNGANLPPQTNFVTGLPFQSGDGSIPPIQSMSARPVIGTTSQITTTNITPGTLFVFEVMGFGHTGANGIDLGFIGMPNCRQYVQPFATILLPVVGGVASASLTIPNNPSYQNVQVFAQSAPLTAGLNPAGILTSNGLCIKAGQ